MKSSADDQLRHLGSAGPRSSRSRSAAWACPGCTVRQTSARASPPSTPRSTRGVTLLDTGDYYGAGHNEMLIGRALQDRRDKALLSVKFGALRAPDGGWIGIDARPAAVKNFLAYTLTRLGVDHVDIYRPGRLDPAVPIEETIGAIADLVKAGYVRAIGLSEVGPETIRRAHAVHPIGDLQIEYSLISRGPEATIFPCSPSSASASRPTAYCRAGCSAVRRRPRNGTSARTCRASPARTASAISGSSRRCRSWPPRKASPPSQLAIAWVLAKGATHRAGHRRAHAGAARRVTRRARGEAHASGARAASRRPFRPLRSPGRATTSIRCGSSTASVERSVRRLLLRHLEAPYDRI